MCFMKYTVNKVTTDFVDHSYFNLILNGDGMYAFHNVVNYNFILLQIKGIH